MIIEIAVYTRCDLYGYKESRAIACSSVFGP